MSHSLSLDVMEMAEAAALLDRLAAGLEATPNTSGVPSPSERSTRPGPCDRTCCWSLEGRGGRDTGHSKKSSRHIVPLFSDPFTPSSLWRLSSSDLDKLRKVKRPGLDRCTAVPSKNPAVAPTLSVSLFPGSLRIQP